MNLYKLKFIYTVEKSMKFKGDELLPSKIVLLFKTMYCYLDMNGRNLNK